MNIKHEMNIAMSAKDQNGNIVPRNQDIIVITSLNDNEDNHSKESKDCVEKFCEGFKPYQGYFILNEDWESFYIPPYDDIASHIRHKIKGDKFIVVDLSKVDKMAFKYAKRY